MSEVSQPAYEDLTTAIRRIARGAPERPAIMTPTDSCTYLELTERIDAAAGYLSAHRVGTGDCVALVLGNGIEYIAGFFATVSLGAVAVAIDPRTGTSELSKVLESVEPSVVIRPSMPLSDATAATLREGSWLSVLDVELRGEGAVTRRLTPEGSGVAPAAIFFTSGTGGRARGVVHTRESLLRVVRALSDTALPESEIWLSPLPVTSIAGHTILCRVLSLGDQLVLPTDFHPRVVLQLIEQARVQRLCLTPAMLALLLRFRGLDGFDLSSLAAIGVGSSPLHPDLANRVNERFGVPLVNSYGSTELGGPVMRSVPEDPGAFVPHDSAAVNVIDDGGRPVNFGGVGELVCRVDSFMFGYHDGGDVRTRDGWYHTGDLAIREPGGTIRLLGRRDDLAFRGGRKVYPIEIENIIAEDDDVEQTAVVVDRSADGYDRLVAFVKLRLPGDIASVTRSLARRCRAGLSSHKVPDRFIVVDELPTTLSGKVVKGELQEQLQEWGRAVERI